MISGGLISRMVIIGEQVEKVQMLVQGCNVEAFSSIFQRCRNGHGNQKSRFAGVFRLLFEGFSHLDDKFGVIDSILFFAAITESWVLPIQICKILR